MKRKIFLVVAFFLLFIGCSEEESPYTYSEEATIYSSSNEVVFRNLLVILKPYVLDNNQKKFLLVDSIYDVKISINTTQWGSFYSLGVDTSVYDKETINGITVCNEEVKYSIIAQYQSEKEALTTAGEYADLLNNYFTLEPGFYICSIESFKMKMTNGGEKTVKMLITEAIEVIPNSRSLFVGEFYVPINF